MNAPLIFVCIFLGVAGGMALERFVGLFVGADLRDLLLAAAAIVGVPLAVWRASSADRTSVAQLTAALAAQKSSDASFKQAEESASKNRVDRHVKAVELLAEANAPIHKRVFAVVSLKELSEIEPSLRKSTFRVLNTFVRSELRVLPESVKETIEGLGKQSIKDAPARREDIASILEVLRFGYGESIDLPERVDLTMCNLYAANLSRGKLASCSLFRTILVRAKLSGANLYKANLGKTVADEAKFLRCDLREANLDHGHFARASFRGSNLEGADLGGSHFDQANFTGASLNKASLKSASLDKASFAGATLVDANLSGARLDQADLREADITGASFDGTWISWASCPRATPAQLEHIARSGAKFMDRDGNEFNPSDEKAWEKFIPEDVLGRMRGSAESGLT